MCQRELVDFAVAWIKKQSIKQSFRGYSVINPPAFYERYSCEFLRRVWAMVNLLRPNHISLTASVSSVQSVPKCRLNSLRLHHRFAKHESLADAGDFSQLPIYQKRVNRSIQGMFRFTLLLSAIFLRRIFSCLPSDHMNAFLKKHRL